MHARSLVVCSIWRIQPDRFARRRSGPAVAILLAAIGVASGAPSPAFAGTVYWNMQTLGATSNTVAGLTVGELTRGQGGGTSITGTVASSGGYTFILNGASTPASGGYNSQSSAIGGLLSTGSSAYFGVTLTNSSAYAMTVEGLGFGSRSTTTGPAGYAIRTSLDGYATDVPGGTGSLPTTSAWVYYTNNLTTPLSIAPGASLDVRIYGWGGSAANLNNVTWRIDDLQIMVVPEPGSIAVGVGAVSLLLLRRQWWRARRRNRISPPSRT